MATFAENTGSSNEQPLEPELAALAARLDELGRVERAAMHPGVSERLVAAGLDEIRAGRPRAVVARIGPRAGVPGRRLSRARLAAALLLAVGIGAAFLAQQRPRPAPAVDVALEQDVEALLAISNGFVGDLAAQVDGLDSDTSELRSVLLTDSGANELLGEEGAL